VSAWSVAVEPGTTAAAWLATHCQLDASCSAVEDETEAVTIDGHPGALVRSTDDALAFALVDDRMYVVAVWRPESDSNLAPYGGATRLLKGFLSTMRLLPGGPAEASWTSYTSDRYDFEIGYPPDWTHQSADRDWTLGVDAADPSSSAMEHFVAPDGSVRVSAWSVAALEPAVILEDLDDFETWVTSYCQRTGISPCTGIHERAVPLCIEKWDCHPGLLVPFDNGVQAFLSRGIFNDKMIVVSLWESESQPAVTANGRSQQVLEAFLSTMGVWPEAVPRDERIVRRAPVPAILTQPRRIASPSGGPDGLVSSS
jgi:hypothetical protein